MLCLGLSLLSCSETENQEEVLNSESNVENVSEGIDTNEEEVAVYTRGEEVNKEEAITTTELATLLETQDSAIVTLTGEVNGVCQKKGCWMTLTIDEETDVRVRFKDYAFFVPLDCEARMTTIKGVAKKDIITVDMLKHYAEDNGDSQEVIDAITEEEIEYSFLAEGVIVE